MTFSEKFFSKTKLNPSTNCIEWQNAKDKFGYGKIKYADGVRSTHRIAFELKYGPIPEDLCVLHKCDNPSCINVDHLFLGTRAENMADKVAKGRQSKGPEQHRNRKPNTGENNGRAKLSLQDVTEIRDLYDNGICKQSELAERYGVDWRQIHRIIKRKHWKISESLKLRSN